MSKTTLLMAAKEYIDRQRGKRSPTGDWEHCKYYFPDQHKERLPCCEKYMEQIQNSPSAIWEHVKSIEHIAKRYEVKLTDLEATIRALKSTRIMK